MIYLCTSLELTNGRQRLCSPSECRTLLQPALSPPSEGRRTFNACASLARLFFLCCAGLRLGVAWLRYWSVVGSLANFLSIAIFTSLYNHFAKRLNDWVR
eukprot:COSAG04_NODE_620_length_11861_cov_65.414215_2_plen_100_part_00